VARIVELEDRPASAVGPADLMLADLVIFLEGHWDGLAMSSGPYMEKRFTLSSPGQSQQRQTACLQRLLWPPRHQKYVGRTTR